MKLSEVAAYERTTVPELSAVPFSSLSAELDNLGMNRLQCVSDLISIFLAALVPSTLEREFSLLFRGQLRGKNNHSRSATTADVPAWNIRQSTSGVVAVFVGGLRPFGLPMKARKAYCVCVAYKGVVWIQVIVAPPRNLRHS